MKKFVGIEIGGSKLQVVCGDGNGRIDRRQRFAVDREAGARGICDAIEQTLKHWNDLEPAGIVVGFGGPVSRQKNAIGTSYHVEGWSGFDLAGWLQNLTGVQVMLENDANTAALGEATQGAGKSSRVVFYVTLGSGTGAGLVVDGRLYYGADMGEAEFGHLRLDRSGKTVESSCSGWAVNKKIRAAANANPDGRLARLLSGHYDAESKILLTALQENDAHAWTIFNETMDDLAFGLSHVVHLFHPDVVVLGGGMSLMGDIIRETVQTKLDSMIMEIFRPCPSVKLSTLREDAVPVGCLTLAGEKFKL